LTPVFDENPGDKIFVHSLLHFHFPVIFKNLEDEILDSFLVRIGILVDYDVISDVRRNEKSLKRPDKYDLPNLVLNLDFHRAYVSVKFLKKLDQVHDFV
jgi:hypothetical protein